MRKTLKGEEREIGNRNIKIKRNEGRDKGLTQRKGKQVQVKRKKKN